MSSAVFFRESRISAGVSGESFGGVSKGSPGVGEGKGGEGVSSGGPTDDVPKDGTRRTQHFALFFSLSGRTFRSFFSLNLLVELRSCFETITLPKCTFGLFWDHFPPTKKWSSVRDKKSDAIKRKEHFVHSLCSSSIEVKNPNIMTSTSRS